MERTILRRLFEACFRKLWIPATGLFRSRIAVALSKPPVCSVCYHRTPPVGTFWKEIADSRFSSLLSDMPPKEKDGDERRGLFLLAEKVAARLQPIRSEDCRRAFQHFLLRTVRL